MQGNIFDSDDDTYGTSKQQQNINNLKQYKQEQYLQSNANLQEDQQDLQQSNYFEQEDEEDQDKKWEEEYTKDMNIVQLAEFNFKKTEKQLDDLCIKFKFNLSKRGIYQHLEDQHGIREIWEDDWYDTYTEDWFTKWVIVCWEQGEEFQKLKLWFQSGCSFCNQWLKENKIFFDYLDSERKNLIANLSQLKMEKIKAEQNFKKEELLRKKEEQEQLNLILLNNKKPKP
ncbi:hypothetical protein PPERSA_12012 [Pseudocohnilembus persalinus]|uniref:Uncharacterized protein n=1 Tax=Pseudocohnilembus persalinus TaxID=266149 RepID=A0A0V0QKW5_PSEPJ|nr:hypothetical protein PPERSA_12012 [Pseudocohnilembus persalinus]|eukprot:KRX02672.1 hypothetical protein PPERSA_12012 [Pseudocohnilembus persalinus]